MDKRLSHLLPFFLCGILLTILFTGCSTEEQKSEAAEETVLPEVPEINDFYIKKQLR